MELNELLSSGHSLRNWRNLSFSKSYLKMNYCSIITAFP